MSESPVIKTEFKDLKLIHRGKVRDLYEVDNKLLMVATDRISAFDVVMDDPVPNKGKVLTRLSLFWFDFLGDILPNHLITADVDQYPLVNEVWRHDDFRLFRQFAVFPILYRVDALDKETCVWFTDLRYFISTMLPSFRYGMCRDNHNNSWQLHRLRRFTKNTRQKINPG